MSNTFKLKNGSILLSTEAPGGIYNASQLKKIAALCDGDSVIVKATEDQRLALFVNPEKANSIATELKAIGLGIRHYQDGLHQPVSCIGEMCENHEQDALGSALDISAEMEGLTLSNPLKIGINGCAKCCVPCHTLDISVVGDSHGYRISLGGKNSQLPEMASFIAEGVPASEMPRLVKAIIELYKTQAGEGETLQEVIDREGAKQFVQILAPWSQDAADTSDPFAANEHLVETQEATNETGDIETEHESTPELNMALIDEENTINHADLSGEEGHELILDDTPLDSNDLNQEQEFNFAANSDSSLSDDLEDIPVDASGDLQDLAVPIDHPSSKIPEIRLQELELADDETMPELIDPTLDPTVDPTMETSMAGSGRTAQSNNTPDSDVESMEHMNESQIDAGDVLRGANAQSSTETALNTETEISVTSPEVLDDGFEEDATMAKLTASIAAQQEILQDDTAEIERDEGAELLDSSDASLEDATDHREDMKMSDDETDSGSYDDHLGVENSDTEHDDGQFDVHDHLPLSEVVATRKITLGGAPAPKSNWSIAGFDIDNQGNPVITWNNGVAITLTKEAIAIGNIRVGGHELRISQKDGGIQFEVDGMKMNLRSAA